MDEQLEHLHAWQGPMESLQSRDPESSVDPDSSLDPEASQHSQRPLQSLLSPASFSPPDGQGQPASTGHSSEKKVFIQTFGCQMNALDSDKMRALLERDGFRASATADQADVVLINTCSIREKAEHKLYSSLGRLKDRPGVVVGVTGCVAQQEGARLLKKFPWLNLVMGPDAIPKVAELVSRSKHERILDTDVYEGLEYPFVSELPESPGESVTAFVTIQKGCDNKCTFCIVPMTRGVEVSRSADEIVEEVRQRVQGGVREITLLGQNVNSYGLKSPGGTTFANLLRKVHDEVPELARLRFTTSHPRDFGPDVIDAFAELPRLMPYLHLPVQSGSNRVLRRMKRYYRIEDYLEKLSRLQEAVPGIALSTDFIVGFPGETEEDFAQTLALMEQVKFHFCYSFVYSPRPGTPALNLKDDVPDKEKKRRLLALQELQRGHTQLRHEAYVGQTLPVLVEGTSRNDPGELMGRVPGMTIVNFPGRPRLIGHTVPVRIVSASLSALKGELILLDGTPS